MEKIIYSLALEALFATFVMTFNLASDPLLNDGSFNVGVVVQKN